MIDFILAILPEVLLLAIGLTLIVFENIFEVKSVLLNLLRYTVMIAVGWICIIIALALLSLELNKYV